MSAFVEMLLRLFNPYCKSTHVYSIFTQLTPPSGELGAFHQKSQTATSHNTAPFPVLCTFGNFSLPIHLCLDHTELPTDFVYEHMFI